MLHVILDEADLPGRRIRCVIDSSYAKCIVFDDGTMAIYRREDEFVLCEFDPSDFRLNDLITAGIMTEAELEVYWKKKREHDAKIARENRRLQYERLRREFEPQQQAVPGVVVSDRGFTVWAGSYRGRLEPSQSPTYVSTSTQQR